jgi:hypothetical protein
MFEMVGRILNPGGDWQSAVATLLNIRRDSVRQLLNGRMPLKQGHFTDLLKVLADRQIELANAGTDLRNWLARQPREEGQT